MGSGYCSINSGGRQKSPLLCEANVGEWRNGIKDSMTTLAQRSLWKLFQIQLHDGRGLHNKGYMDIW